MHLRRINQKVKHSELPVVTNDFGIQHECFHLVHSVGKGGLSRRKPNQKTHSISRESLMPVTVASIESLDRSANHTQEPRSSDYKKKKKPSLITHTFARSSRPYMLLVRFKNLCPVYTSLLCYVCRASAVWRHVENRSTYPTALGFKSFTNIHWTSSPVKFPWLADSEIARDNTH